MERIPQQKKTVADWALYSLQKAENEQDPALAAAYRAAAERLQKFPYNSGLAMMGEAEFRRVLGWNKFKTKLFRPGDSERTAA